MKMWEGMSPIQKILTGAGLGLGIYGLLSSFGGGGGGGGKGGGGMGMMGPLLAAGGIGTALYSSGLLNKITGGLFGDQNRALPNSNGPVQPPQQPLRPEMPPIVQTNTQ